jgi:hypothetical protein
VPGRWDRDRLNVKVDSLPLIVLSVVAHAGDPEGDGDLALMIADDRRGFKAKDRLPRPIGGSGRVLTFFFVFFRSTRGYKYMLRKFRHNHGIQAFFLFIVF